MEKYKKCEILIFGFTKNKFFSLSNFKENVEETFGDGNLTKSDKLNNIELEHLKMKQIKTKKSKILIREILINFIFLYVLFITCYFTNGESMYSFNNHIKYTTLQNEEFKDIKTFVSNSQNGNFTEKNFWHWLSNEFMLKLNAKSYYNGQDFASINLYLNDMTSVLIGYPIMRQLRINKGKLLKYLFLVFPLKVKAEFLRKNFFYLDSNT